MKDNLSDKRIPIDGFAWRPLDLLERLRSPELPGEEFWRSMSYALYVMKDDEDYIATLNEVKKERTKSFFPQQEATTPQNVMPDSPLRLASNRNLGSHKNQSKSVKNFREFIKDANQTEEIMLLLHNLIGNKTNTNALRIIAKAMWLDLIDRPTSTSIKNEFATITCSDTIISNVLNEEAPMHPHMMEEIRKEFNLL
ncbi:MAG: hypothetical protein K6F43_02690 [Prevotella sp.]|nr:hypothetical protein [Prevotella sp.]